jgi:hypothetical protein
MFSSLRGIGVEENIDVVPPDVVPSDGWETLKLMQLRI